MANTLIPIEERILSPEEVAVLDARRRHGQLLIVIGFQFTIVATLLTLWSGQDLTYSPGWHHPMAYWDAFCALAALCCFVRGLHLRKGLNEFFSY
jgi:hypothetical protein